MFYAPPLPPPSPEKSEPDVLCSSPQRQRAAIRDGFLFLPGMSTCQLILLPNQRRKAEIE